MPAERARPLLIAAEGHDHSGKTAGVERLARWLERKGRRVSVVPWTASPLVRSAAASSRTRIAAGDALALLTDIGVDLALHGHVHRAHAWRVSDSRHDLVVASAGALVNDGRRDASFLEVVAEDGRLEVRRRSVATGRPTLLYDGTHGAIGPAPRMDGAM